MTFSQPPSEPDPEIPAKIIPITDEQLNDPEFDLFKEIDLFIQSADDKTLLQIYKLSHQPDDPQHLLPITVTATHPNVHPLPVVNRYVNPDIEIHLLPGVPLTETLYPIRKPSLQELTVPNQALLNLLSHKPYGLPIRSSSGQTVKLLDDHAAICITPGYGSILIDRLRGWLSSAKRNAGKLLRRTILICLIWPV